VSSQVVSLTSRRFRAHALTPPPGLVRLHDCSLALTAHSTSSTSFTAPPQDTLSQIPSSPPHLNTLTDSIKTRWNLVLERSITSLSSTDWGNVLGGTYESISHLAQRVSSDYSLADLKARLNPPKPAPIPLAFEGGAVERGVEALKREQLVIGDLIRKDIPGNMNDPIGRRVEKGLGIDDVGRGRLV
jgi:hypothetical protein